MSFEIHEVIALLIAGNTKIYLKPLASKKLNAWESALKKQPIPEVGDNGGMGY